MWAQLNKKIIDLAFEMTSDYIQIKFHATK